MLGTAEHWGGLSAGEVRCVQDEGSGGPALHHSRLSFSNSSPVISTSSRIPTTPPAAGHWRRENAGLDCGHEEQLLKEDETRVREMP